VRRRVAFAVVLLAAVVAPLAYANPGGVGDGSRASECGSACHLTQGTAPVQIWSLDLAPTAGTRVDVLVLYRPPWPDAVNATVGVFLVTSGPGDNRPSLQGWAILGDPHGGTANYVEQGVLGSRWATFQWALLAPATPGTYELHAQVNRGDGVAIYERAAAPLVFQVSGAVAGKPVIIHTPVTDANAAGPVSLTASTRDAASVALLLRPEGQPGDTAQAMVLAGTENGTSTWTADFPAPAAGASFEYRLRAVNGTLFTETAVFNVTLHSPDLVAGSLRVAPDPAVSMTSVVTATVRNLNLIEVRGFAVTFTADGVPLKTLANLTIPANATLTYASEWVPDSGGEAILTFRVDAESAVAETDEGNNAASLSVGVTTPPAPAPGEAAPLYLPLAAMVLTAVGVVIVWGRSCA